MDERRRALETFAKQMKEGIPFSEELLGSELDGDVHNNALLARNLSEETLANEVLKNTGLKIPDDKASLSKREDFLNRMVAERYPELKDPNLRIGDESYYQKGGIFVRDQPDIRKQLSDSLHEAGHSYDDKVTGYHGKELNNSTLRKAKASGMDLKSIDPTQAYEILSEGHHAKIPNLREGSYGFGALKSMMKNGTFKALPIIGTALGAASALSSGDVSAAIPGLDQAESLGPEKGSVDDMIENPKAGMTQEQRKKALDMLLKQQENM